MDLTISRPVKILLLVLVLAGVGGIASLTMLGKSSPSASSAPPIPTAAQLRAQRAAAAAKTATTATTTSTAAKAPAAPVHHAVAPKPKPAPKPATAANGLPLVLDDALRQHRIVVVSVFDPESQTDAVTYAEARAGAADAHAGFLGVSVLDDSVAGPLTVALPAGQLLPVPGVLIFRRPGVLVERIDGFTDRDSVAALAGASLTAEPYSATAAAAAATPAATTTAAVAPAPAPAPATTTTP